MNTEAMVVGYRPNLKKISDGKIQSPSFAIGDSKVGSFEQTKYWGIQRDQHLVWDELTRFLGAKVSHTIRFLCARNSMLRGEPDLV